MKVYIGPYNHWFQPYQWAKKLVRWWYGLLNEKRVNLDEYDRVNSIARRRFSWLNELERWVDARYTRKVKVRIDDYDTWSADNTLAVIVLPMLRQLKETKHGSPAVEDEDVPEELRSTSAEPLTEAQISTGHTDNNWHKRWEWALEEMIWAFEQIVDDDADSKFFEHPENEDEDLATAIRNTKFDKEGYTAWQNRKTRGLTLFGKYFEGLWD